MEATLHSEPFAELAHRATDGMEVSLLWTRADNGLVVSVVDLRAGDAFELPVGDRDPLDVFYHPYAYAAFHGIDYRVLRPGRPELAEA